MNRTQYRAARKLIKENGYFALKWLPDDQRLTMIALRFQTNDWLAERAYVVTQMLPEMKNPNEGLKVAIRYDQLTDYRGPVR